jgi:hypothetical protein
LENLAGKGLSSLFSGVDITGSGSIGTAITNALGITGDTAAVQAAGAAQAAAGIYTVFHQGGVVGGSGYPTRSADPAIFVDAPRFHTGLGSDEYAAILQRGERVLTANQNDRTAATMSGLATKMQAGAQGGRGGNVVFNISTPNADSFRASQGQLAAKQQVEMRRLAQRNG